MGKFKTIIIFLLAIVAFGTGMYFKDDVARFYNDLRGQVESFQEADLGQIILEVQKKVSLPAPLRTGGAENQVVLVKSKIIEETNVQRQNSGSPVLKENVKLTAAAVAKADDMFLNQYFEHESPAGIDPGELVNSYGYNYILAGENLILGNFDSEKEVVENWMQSIGHRENILNTKFTEIGVAIIKGNYNGESVWIGVQEFGLPLSSCSQPDKSLKDQIDSDKTQLEWLSSQLDERKEQIKNTDPKSSAYNQMVSDYNQLVKDYNSLAQQLKLKILQYNTQVNIFNACVAGK